MAKRIMWFLRRREDRRRRFREANIITMTIMLIILFLTCSYGGVENEESMKRPIINSSEGIYFSVRSTVKFHSTRLPSIILTWLKNIHPSQVKIR